MNLSGSTVLSISREKGEDDTKSRAFQTACCSPVRIVFWATCFFVQGLSTLWSGWYEWVCLRNSELWLEDGRRTGDAVSPCVEADSSQTWVEGPMWDTLLGASRWERFTLFLGLSFAGDLSRAFFLKSSISRLHSCWIIQGSPNSARSLSSYSPVNRSDPWCVLGRSSQGSVCWEEATTDVWAWVSLIEGRWEEPEECSLAESLEVGQTIDWGRLDNDGALDISTQYDHEESPSEESLPHKRCQL